MSHKSDQSLNFSDLTLVLPTISDNLSIELKQPAISNDLMPKQLEISGNLSIELEQPVISDDLT